MAGFENERLAKRRKYNREDPEEGQDEDGFARYQSRLLDSPEYPSEEQEFCVTPSDQSPSVSEQELRPTNKIVCYGTLDHAPVTHNGSLHGLFNPSSRFHEVQLSSSDTSVVIVTNFGQYAGLLCTSISKSLSIVSAAGARVQGYVDVEGLKKHAKRRDGVTYEILINMYGPRDAAYRIGDLLLEQKMFLQSPIRDAWDLSYPYFNPQCSSIFGDTMEIDDPIVGSNSIGLLCRRLTISVSETQDYLHAILPVASLEPVPEELDFGGRITTSLMAHQKSAVKFMQGIERNVIQGHSSAGGILADQPGLGKSLTSLALIASGLPSPNGPIAAKTSCSTLLVVPSSTITTWQLQVAEHFAPGKLCLLTYIGTGRRATLAKCDQLDLVLTSYETLVKDYLSLESEVFSSHWHRLIVDEAHFIKNRSTRRFQALYAVKARFRWCLTGTPIENGIDDIGSLLNFLRIAPFHVNGEFQRQVTAPLRRGDITGLQRLQKAVSKTMVRRTKEMLDLPSRSDLVVEVDLSQREREIYELAHDASDTLINESLSRGSASPDVNILQSLLRQRQICCHGLELLPAPTRATFNRSYRINTAMKDIENIREFPVFCEVCSAEWDPGDRGSLLEDCIHIICSKCLRLRSESTDMRCPLCTDEELSTNKPSQKTHSLQAWANDLQYQGPSSKVSALLEKLCSARDQKDGNGHVTKSVVFSSWTRLLHLTGLALKEANINFELYTGGVSRDGKEKALTNFQNNPQVTVLLISIGSGGVGLNLTAASQIHLLEPQWNPMVESQAFDRVHRIGQKNSVTTYRYIAKDTFEESIRLLQSKKLELVDLTLHGESDHQGNSQKRLQDLRSVFR